MEGMSMKIRSDYKGTVFFRFFTPDDKWYWTGVYDNTLEEGMEITVPTPSAYQLEIKKENALGEFLKTPWKWEKIAGVWVKACDPIDPYSVDGFHVYEDGTVAIIIHLFPVEESDRARPGKPTLASTPSRGAWTTRQTG
jgi:hypothetical protein